MELLRSLNFFWDGTAAVVCEQWTRLNLFEQIIFVVTIVPCMVGVCLFLKKWNREVRLEKFLKFWEVFYRNKPADDGKLHRYKDKKNTDLVPKLYADKILKTLSKPSAFYIAEVSKNAEKHSKAVRDAIDKQILGSLNVPMQAMSEKEIREAMNLPVYLTPTGLKEMDIKPWQIRDSVPYEPIIFTGSASYLPNTPTTPDVRLEVCQRFWEYFFNEIKSHDICETCGYPLSAETKMGIGIYHEENSFNRRVEFHCPKCSHTILTVSDYDHVCRKVADYNKKNGLPKITGKNYEQFDKWQDDMLKQIARNK